MSTPIDTLTRWRGSVHSILEAMRGSLITTNPQQRRELLEGATETAVVLLNQIEQAGGEREDRPQRRSNVPLDKLSTPASRDYAKKLRIAYEAALVVDEERYGENIGTDGPAQMIEMVLWDVEADAFGAAGKE